MTFRAVQDGATESEDGTLLLPQPDDDEINEAGVAARHSDTKLQTALSSSKLQSRLRSIAYDAKTVESEQGVNILYLALSFLTWFEPRELEKPHYAPLILVPVTLTRDNANERFKIKYCGEELATNLSLQQRLREEGVELPDLPDMEDLSPSAYAAIVAEKVSAIPHWEVRTDTLVLGFFSFAKLMMYRDLEPDRWPPQVGLRDHPLIQGLLGDGFRSDPRPLPPEDAPADPLVDIAAAGHVVDADSSQILAIHLVERGRDLVIQGPPGTGKSQTITNLIASAVRHGKRVLFIAEKRAALQVVRANLDRIGLGQVCLELHSHKAKKKVVLDDLEQTYQLAEHAAVDPSAVSTRLRARRDELNRHAQRMHTPLHAASEFTPFEIFGTLARLAGEGVPACDIDIRLALECPRPVLEEHLQKVKHVGELISSMELPTQHPWRHVGLDAVLPNDAERFAERAGRIATALEDLLARGQVQGQEIGLSCSSATDLRTLGSFGELVGRAPPLDKRALRDPVWLDSRGQVTSLVEHGATFRRLEHQLRGVLKPEAWSADFADVRQAFALHGKSFLRVMRKEYRVALARFRSVHVGPPPRPIAHRLRILDALSSGQRAREHLHRQDAIGRAALGTMWQGETTDWDAAGAIVKWEEETAKAQLPGGWRDRFEHLDDPSHFGRDTAALVKDSTETILSLRSLIETLSLDLTARFGTSNIESISLNTLIGHLHVLAATPDRLHQWCTWRLWSRDLAAAGLAAVVERLADGRIPHLRADSVVRYACFETLARLAFSEHPELAVFDGIAHDAIMTDFQRLDRDRMILARQEVMAQQAAMMPKGALAVGEIGILAREWRKQKRHLPIRQLIKAAGRAVQGIKPVWMMSPLSLAQFVEPGALHFDLLLIDEASQVRPIEALGAICRARQIVVVGDDKQLPPTSFFDRLASNDEEPVGAEDFQASDVESILGLCSSQGIPDRMLRWHYRSQHESLIAISNLEFYKRLFIVPSASSDDLGLVCRRVSGVYDRGRSATNRLEAQEVARAVIEHASKHRRSARYPEGMSLGVGAFSVAQRDAILDELELLWRQRPDLAEFFDPDAPEPFFVKNLESIQGDERDVVFISVGYGPDASGYMAMSFGPLSAQGGERRLNVLITRARRRCEVFSSIASADIDLARTQSIGVRVLKSFLHYAETGHLELPTPGSRPAGSDFEDDVGAALAAAGYDVRQQVGVAGFFVDLAVTDPTRPGGYLLGIECDGATYHNSRSARDRDRLREQVLRDRGWRIHRIWSTDWFRRRQQELQRAIAAIEAARITSVPPERTEDQGRSPFEPTIGNTPEHPSRPTHPVAADTATTHYAEATFSVRLEVEPHLLRTTEFLAILIRIVAAEQPIHGEEIARRYAEVCGKDRAGSRIQEAVERTLRFAVKAGALRTSDDFYALQPMSAASPRDRSSVRSSTLRHPRMLPRLEIRTGLRQIVADHIGVEPQAAIVEIARMLGFQRTGQELQKVIEDELRSMLGDSTLVLRNGNRLYLAE